MKAKVDPDICVGTGSCVSICPQVFQLGDEGVAVVQEDPIPEDIEDEVREAADACPVDAITLDE